MLNRVTIIGNLGADPDIRNTQAGSRIANFRVATTERWRDKDGDQKERTEWIPVVVINQMLVGVVESRLTKGSQVFVEGSFQTRKYTDNAGVERYISEVMVGNFGSKLVVFRGAHGPQDQDFDRGAQRSTRPRQQAEQPQPGGDAAGAPDFDDDLPF